MQPPRRASKSAAAGDDSPALFLTTPTDSEASSLEASQSSLNLRATAPARQRALSKTSQTVPNRDATVTLQSSTTSLDKKQSNRQVSRQQSSVNDISLAAQTAEASRVSTDEQKRLAREKEEVRQKEARRARIFGSIDQIMSEVKTAWSMLTEETYTPIPLAVEMILGSSKNRSFEKFGRLFEGMERAMDVIVEEYHEGFNTAIQLFSSVVENLNDSQKRVQTMKRNLLMSKSGLTSMRQDMLDLWVKSVQHKEMLRIIDQIEDLKQVPSRVETQYQGKRYYSAVKQTVSALRILKSEECSAIPALQDLTKILSDKRANMHIAVIEELHHQIYLRGSTAELRVEQYLAETMLHDAPKQIDPVERDPTESDDVTSPFDLGPESDPAAYLISLVQSIIMLARVPEAVAILQQKMPREIYNIIEDTIYAVEEQYVSEGPLKSLNVNESYIQLQGFGSISHLFNIPSKDASIMNDLFNALFVRLAVVLDNHIRILGFVANTVSRRRTLSDPSLSPDMSLDGSIYSIQDVWHVLLVEMRAFLEEYVTSAVQLSTPASGVSVINDVMMNKKPFVREKPKCTFKFQEFSLQNATAVDNHDTNATSGSQGRRPHRLIIRPNLNMISLVYQPVREFMSKMQMTLLPNFTEECSINEYLEEFLLLRFLPKTEELLTQTIFSVMNESDSFLIESSAVISNGMLEKDPSARPVYKAATTSLYVIQAVCKNVISTYRDEYASLIESILVRVYEKFESKYRAIVASEDGLQLLIASGKLVEDKEMRSLLLSNTLLQGSYDATSNAALSEKEVLIMANFKRDRSLHLRDIVLDMSKLQSLANLHHSLDWFLAQISKLEKNSVTAKLNPRASITDLHTKMLVHQLMQSGQGIYLPFTKDTLANYREIMSKLRELSDSCLFTLHVEVRSHCLYYMDLAMREGVYFLDEAATVPDSYVVALNSDLTQFEAMAAVHLPANKNRFLFEGLSHVIIYAIFNNVRDLKRMNLFGAEKMLRNIQALQQNLVILSALADDGLNQAQKYFELFRLHVDDFLKYAREHSDHFTLHEYKQLVDLMYTEVHDSPDAPRRREYQSLVNRLKVIYDGKGTK